MMAMAWIKRIEGTDPRGERLLHLVRLAGHEVRSESNNDNDTEAA